MDLTLYTIIRGLAIGILVSAPMGPIGILCIQRTLNKGRWSGFVTGLGAALSDLIYALLTGLGMSIVIDFIEANQNILQILGSLVFIVFAFAGDSTIINFFAITLFLFSYLYLSFLGKLIKPYILIADIISLYRPICPV